MNKLLSEVIEAHGGLKRWNGISDVGCNLTSFGELLKVKEIPPSIPGATSYAVKTSEQMCFVTMQRSAGAAIKATCTPNQVVIESFQGQRLAELVEPRETFFAHDFNTPWTQLQALYFSGYAMWMYLTMPFSLAMDGVQVWDIEPLEEGDECWRGIRAVMPSKFATHSRAQEFYFGSDMLLRRQDYTVDVASGIRVANYAIDIQDVDGIKLPSKRRAYLCDKKYTVLRDKLFLGLDFNELKASKKIIL